MKFTDKMQLLKQGVSFAEIKELEMEEAAEIEASKKHPENEPKEPENEPKTPEVDKTTDADVKELKSALEVATKALEESKATIEKQKDELTKLNEDFTKLVNKQTVAEKTELTATDVMKELYNPDKKKEVN